MGVYLDAPTPSAVAQGIRQALRLPIEARAQSRQKILDDFPLEKRRQALINLVEKNFL
jgi:hypothetical protein